MGTAILSLVVVFCIVKSAVSDNKTDTPSKVTEVAAVASPAPIVFADHSGKEVVEN